MERVEENNDVPLLSLKGLVSHNSEEDVVIQGSALGRGDKRRNNRISQLRGLVPLDHAIVGIDLADEKQAVVVCDHDSRVLARQRLKAKTWQLAPVLQWARGIARKHGFTDVTVGCEPTGHRWRVLDQLAVQENLALVCVQPLLVGRAREREDYTRDKTDDKDAVLIARLVAQLHCYVPERPDATWARLRQLGARRNELITAATRYRQQIADLLDCAWPAVMETAKQHFHSPTWCAAVAIVLKRCAGDPTRLIRGGRERFRAAVRRELPHWGGQRLWRPIADAIYTALSDPAGAHVQRLGALERARWALTNWRSTKTQLNEVEACMVGVLGEVGLADLMASIPGVSAVGAAAILAETGDPTRFASPRALVKHAGLCPRENASGTTTGRSRLSGRGRPGLRLAAWRAVWGALLSNPVMAARYRHLTTRETNRLHDGQARAALAAALLRWIHVITTRRVAWDPALAGNPDLLTPAA